MRAITAVEPLPAPLQGPPCLFLAGGITGCPDWQAEALERLLTSATVLNPRRPNFPMGDRAAGAEQIAWEYQALGRAHVILFWFAAEQIQPIALFELGSCALSGKTIVVGAHPEYPRRFDVVEQMALARPGLVIYDTLAATVTVAEAELRGLERLGVT